MKNGEGECRPLRGGLTRQIKLVKGHFVCEYAAPEAVRNAVESKWRMPLNKAGKSEMTHMR